MQEQNIISSLVELTRQRDQASIRNKLLSALIEITDAAWLVLCRYRETKDEQSIEVLDRIPNPSSDKAVNHYPIELFEQIELFKKSLSSINPIWVQEMDSYQAIIFKIPGDESHKDFVVLFDKKVHGRSERMVCSILDLYENFLQLVIENTQDPLTRLLNRGVFDIDLPDILLKMNEKPDRRAQPRPGQLRNFLAMFDLDHFKRINDNFGHLYGDEVILIFSSILRGLLEGKARLYRYGGEEFAAIIERITIEELHQLVEELRLSVEEYDFPQVGKVTVSIGVAELKANNLPSTLLDFADRALYHSKENGRNQVTHFEDIYKPKRERKEQHEEVVFF